MVSQVYSLFADAVVTVKAWVSKLFHPGPARHGTVPYRAGFRVKAATHGAVRRTVPCSDVPCWILCERTAFWRRWCAKRSLTDGVMGFLSVRMIANELELYITSCGVQMTGWICQWNKDSTELNCLDLERLSTVSPPCTRSYSRHAVIELSTGWVAYSARRGIIAGKRGGIISRHASHC